jgi:hypothetical protein
MKRLELAGRRMSSWTGALLLMTGTYSAFTQPFIPNIQITITAPTNDSSFTAPTNVQIDAVTVDTNNNDIAYVVFTASRGGHGVRPLYEIVLGTVSNGVPTGGPGSNEELYALTWTNVPIGTWVLTAQVVTSNGPPWFEPSSPPVVITVGGSTDLSVDIASPTNGATFSAPADIELIAGAKASVGAIASVQFFDGTNDLGIVTNGAVVDPPGSPGLTPGSLAYFLTWSNAPVGSHVLTALATDTNGESAVSDPVFITVTTNYPPAFSVTITEPTNGSSFTAPTNIVIDAVTFDTNNDVGSVAFFATPHGHSLLPIVLFLGTSSNGVPTGPAGSDQELFTITWSNAPIGSWDVTAHAYPTNGWEGGQAVSSPVEITIEASTDLTVDIATPTNGAVFTAPAVIQLIAGASANAGAVASVQFFDGLTSLGIVSNGVVVDPPGSPGLTPGSLAYSLTWSKAAVGFHNLTAVATDTNGESAVSAAVDITVITNYPPPPPPSPVVRITSPPNNAVFTAPVNIGLFAFAFDGDVSVSNVQFYAGTNDLGYGAPVPFATPWPGTTNHPGGPGFPTNVFELIWSNPPPASYVLTAVAQFSTGVFATSAPVDISVVTPPPPPTNHLDLVNIEAIDPVAVEGTNCWTWLGLTNISTNTPPTWSNWMSPTAVCVLFTNCGPVDATFAVSRRGETNDELTLSYTISGTASNGVDYVLLPGTVEIPAGQRQALITIVPIDADTNSTPETVILSLSPSTNSTPDYAIGFPSRAEGLIVNSESPHPLLTGRMLHDHTFCLSMNGPNGGWFRIDYSTNCLSWTPVCTNQVVGGLINFADPNAAGSAARWYRTVPLPHGPNN